MFTKASFPISIADGMVAVLYNNQTDLSLVIRRPMSAEALYKDFSILIQSASHPPRQSFVHAHVEPVDRLRSERR